MPRPAGHHAAPDARRVSAEVKRHALQLVLDGAGFRAAARQEGVAHSAMGTWFKELAEATPDPLATPTGAPEHVDLDELRNPRLSKRKNEVYVMTAVERETPCILGWRVATHRTEAVPRELIDAARNAFHYCTEGFSIYEGRDYQRG